MLIKELRVFNYRNLIDQQLTFDYGFNLFYGQNAQGKTNLLEAIYFNITGQSFRTTTIKDLYKYNEKETACSVDFIDNSGIKKITLKSVLGKNSYWFNKSRVKYDDYFNKLSVVSFIPDDINLILDSPKKRRRYFNFYISQLEFNYFILLKEFNKVLKNRNKILKEDKIDKKLLEIYTVKYIEISSQLIMYRLDYLKRLNKKISIIYKLLFGKDEELIIGYESELDISVDINIDEIKQRLTERYNNIKEKELLYKYSYFGPQRDDYIFLLNNKNSKYYSSQGEKKSIIITTKISQADVIIDLKKETPIFLIDDISSYFDKKRKQEIINYLKKRDMQIFLTTTERLDIDGKKFLIKKGEINVWGDS